MIPMKTKLHKLASLLLAFALTLCLALPAGAVGGDGVAAASISPDSKGSITVSGAENGVTVYVYKLMDVNVDATAGQPQEPVYSWVDGVAGWVRTNYGTYIGEEPSATEPADNSVKEAFSTASAEDVAKFYDALAAAIRSGGANGVTLNPANTSGTIATDGSCTIKNLAMGNYLVLIEGGMKVYRPSAVNLVPVWKEATGAGETSEWVLSDAVVELKSSDLTLTKQVYDGEITNVPAPAWGETAQVAIGDTVTFKLTAPVPNYPENALHDGYEISDNLPAGLALGNVTVNGVQNGTSPTSTPLTEGENGAYVLTKADSTATRPTGGQNANVTFNLEFDYDKIKDYDKIEVTYIATVNADIKVIGQDGNTNGNINTAYLDYNNNPYGTVADSTNTWKTAQDTATVFTYGMEITKTDDAQQANRLTGAEFTLHNAGADGDATGNALTFVEIGTGSGTYRLAKSDETSANTKLVVGGESVGEMKGVLKISGLDVGTYILTETKAPDGYNLPSKAFEIIINDSKTSGGDGSYQDGANGKTDTTDDNNNTTEVNDGYVSTKIPNTKGFTLPTTGGMGTVLFTAGGVLLMGAGLVVLVLFLRRRTSR